VDVNESALYGESGAVFSLPSETDNTQQQHLGKTMAKKITKPQPWTKDDVRALKTMAREKVKTTEIARKLKRSLGATHQKAMRLGVTLGARRKTKKSSTAPPRKP
jgi:hypothetical protein